MLLSFYCKGERHTMLLHNLLCVQHGSDLVTPKDREYDLNQLNQWYTVYRVSFFKMCYSHMLKWIVNWQNCIDTLYRLQYTTSYQKRGSKIFYFLSNFVKLVQGIHGNMKIFWVVSLIDNKKFTMADSCLFHLIFVLNGSLQVVYKDTAALFH